MLLDGLDRTLLVVGLGAARTVPLTMSIPAFGGPHLAAPIRFGLGLALAGLCYPLLFPQLPHGGDWLWALMVAREVVVGVVMGFVGSCAFRAAEISGQLTDLLRGANATDVLSFATADRTSPLGGLMLLLAVVVFYGIGGPGMVATALAQSYEAIPWAESVRCDGCAHTMVVMVIAASAKLVEASVGLCAPALASLLLVDVTLGVVGRATRQMSLHLVGIPLRALLGISAVLVSLGALDLALQKAFHGFFGLLVAASRLGR